MSVFFTLEASQPCGKTYRLWLGVQLAPQSGFGTSLTNKVVLTKRGTPGNGGALFRFSRTLQRQRPSPRSHSLSRRSR
jgi:hypothetical protein